MKQFWMRFPGIFYGTAVLAGVLFYFQFPYPLLIGASGKNRIKIFGFYLLALLSYINTNISVNTETPGIYNKGIGYYSIHKIRCSIGKKKDTYNYQGTLDYFKSGEKEYYNLPCYATVNDDKMRPLGNCDYFVKGKVSHIGHGLYKMHVDEWSHIDNTFSLAEIRLNLKQKMRAYLKKHVHHRLTYGFFASLGTGEIENKLLGALFSRAGVSHTLAISGFHYTWLLIALWGIASIFFPGRGTPITMLILITAYFFFIGESPSLKRAWLASSIYCFSMILNRSASGLNSLGIATAISLILDPEAIFSVGYQLSYLATFSILAIYPTVDQLASKFLPDKPPWDLKEMGPLSQLVSKTACLIRRIVVLTLVVNATTASISLHHFGEFSWWGLIFNLFFPMAITVSLLGIFAGTLPWIGPSILWANEWYSKQLIETIYWCVNDGNMLSMDISGWTVVWIVSGVIIGGMWLESRRPPLRAI